MLRTTIELIKEDVCYCPKCKGLFSTDDYALKIIGVKCQLCFKKCLLWVAEGWEGYIPEEQE